MRLWLHGLGFIAVAFGTACAAAGGAAPGAGGMGGAGMTASGTATATGTVSGAGVTVTGAGGANSCAKFTAEAQQAPAAMLFVLDRSASMTTQNKWPTSQLAIVQAIDDDTFDSMSLGLSAFPAPPGAAVAGPACLGGFPIYCGFATLPQVAIGPAGMDKSNAPQGVRHNIYSFLTQTGPEGQDLSDSSAIYDALNAGYTSLKMAKVERRIAVLVTDGGFSCTSVSKPLRPGISDGACADWEYPDTVNALIKGARLDPNAPVETFIVGVPGSDSIGMPDGNFATAPYHMKLAMSTYAVSGSPNTVDPACDKNAVFTQNGADPAKPCHFDLSQGGAFNAAALASAIASIRGKVLPCTYDLPKPPPGQTIDLGLVNVNLTLNTTTATLPKRKDPANACLADGCWDYTGSNAVQLVGKACSDVSAAKSAKVEITVGCQTILK